MDERIYVICGNNIEYREYLRKNHLNPNDCVYVHHPSVLRGKVITYYDFYGTFYFKSNISEIMSVLYERIYNNDINSTELKKRMKEKSKMETKKKFDKIWESEFDFL